MNGITPPDIPANSVYTSCYCEENIYLLSQAFVDINVSPRWEAFAVFISNERKMVALWNQKANDDVVVWDYHVILVLRPARNTGEPHLDISTTEENPSLESWVYDFDTRRSMPCSGTDYVSHTFPFAFQATHVIDPRHVSSFRVVPVQIFLDCFASDRSHMIKVLSPAVSDEVASNITHYYSPPPIYPPLCGSTAKEKGVTHNLMDSFVSMKMSSSTPSAHDAMQTPDSESELTRDLPSLATSAALGREYGYGEVMDFVTFLSWLRQ